MIGHPLGPALGFVLAVVLFLNTSGLDEVAGRDQLGPGFWPRLVLAGLALACLARMIGEWRRRPGARSRGPSAGAPASGSGRLPEISPAVLAAAIALIVLYVLAAPGVGFALATAGFIAGFMGLCGSRSVPAIAANALLGTVGLLYLFIKFVYLPLPKGAGPFETATLALYRALHLF